MSVLQYLQMLTNVLIKAIPLFYKYQKRQSKEKVLSELLEFNFILADLIGTAEKLFKLIKRNEKINYETIDKNKIKINYNLIQTYLTIQLQRLRRLGDIFIDNPSIDLLEPNLRKQFNDIIGDKEKGLYSIGAALFFNQIFGGCQKQNEKPDESLRRVAKEKYKFACNLYGLNYKRPFQINKQKEILSNLKILRNKYVEALGKITSSDEKIFLAKKAKELANKHGLRN